VTDQPKPILIAEPKHRVGAAGISSGLSLRQFPKSTVEKVTTNGNNTLYTTFSHLSPVKIQF
jgi:hypothetical protein